MNNRIYAAIDLKSYYASVECIERGLDPLTTNLVVVDKERSEKTICLAVSPSLKEYDIPGRARLFEVVQRVNAANNKRQLWAPGRTFTGSSYDSKVLRSSPELSVDYITAKPRMALYLEKSTNVYRVYLKHIAPEDIIIYSVDEVFMEITGYLRKGVTAREFVMNIILDVLATTGITATGGIGTNLYLAKVAMDIGAKHIEPDSKGVRIAELDEMSYRRTLWSHRPITDFWRVGKGYARKLEENGMFTMGDVALCSKGGPGDYLNEDLLYRLFGINAELLIDHAWGWEPCTISDVLSYEPEDKSAGSGQVLPRPYLYEDTKKVVKGMAERLVRDLLEKKLVTDQVVLTVGYDIENLTDAERKKHYHGAVTIDQYGRAVPKHAHGTGNLKKPSSSKKLIMQAVMELFDRIVDPNLLSRRLTLTANKLVPEDSLSEEGFEQLDLFTDYKAEEAKRAKEAAELEREKKMQKAILSITKKYGNNAILSGVDLEEGSTTRERNKQIGGHKA